MAVPASTETNGPLWRDADAAPDDRVADLLARLTLEEKISLLNNDAPAIERVGLPRFKYSGEALHGLCNTGRATGFPMPIGLAATFDEPLVEQVADAAADEMRAKFHSEAWKHSIRVSLMVWSPVINILRDPRWGRAQETYGEDPHLTGRLGAAYVRGLQGRDPHLLKLAACAKHLGVHSGPEKLRQEFNAVASRKDMMETYLPAFGRLAEAGVATIMATYNRVNGFHCCAHPFMIGEYLRRRCGYEGMIVSDGGALNSLHRSADESAPAAETAGKLNGVDGRWHRPPRGHNLTNDTVETAALCLSENLDFELGHHALHRAAEAIERGLMTEQEIDRAVRRILRVQCRLGVWDAPTHPYTRIPLSVIECEKHVALAREAACKSIVLLKNTGDTLPLRQGRDDTVLVSGPTATDLQILLGNFYKGTSGRLVSLLEGITGQAPEGVTVTHSQGAFAAHPNLFNSHWFLGLAQWADAVVACVGFTPLMEGEQGECIGTPVGGDKESIALPGHQLEFLRRLRATIDAHAQPQRLVVVVTGGCPLELGEVHELADALLMAWYPGQEGGNAVGDVIWGKVNPSGRLPATFPHRLDDLPPYEDYAMRGRTYRYMEKEVLYPFGYGLSYTDFTIGPTAVTGSTATAEITNSGKTAGEAVPQLYARWPDRPDAPHCSLVGFQRMTLAPGETCRAEISFRPQELMPLSEAGEPVPGPHRIELAVCRHAPVASAMGGSSVKWTTLTIGS